MWGCIIRCAGVGAQRGGMHAVVARERDCGNRHQSVPLQQRHRPTTGPATHALPICARGVHRIVPLRRRAVICALARRLLARMPAAHWCSRMLAWRRRSRNSVRAPSIVWVILAALSAGAAAPPVTDWPSTCACTWPLRAVRCRPRPRTQLCGLSPPLLARACAHVIHSARAVPAPAGDHGGGHSC